MIDPEDFARRQMDLSTEFAKFVLEHPEIDQQLPEAAYVYFEVDGESEFNQYSRELARRRERDDDMTPVCVRVRGLTPPQASRLIDPQILPSPNLA